MIRSLKDGLHASGFSGDALLRPHYAVGYKSVNLMDWTCAANSHVGQDLCGTDFQMRFLETRFQKPQSQFRKGSCPYVAATDPRNRLAARYIVQA